MKRFFVAFFIALFILCGGLGYGVATQVRALAEETPAWVTPANQLNLILVRVDDLTQNDPALVSVWGVFVSRSEFSSMILKQIYPDIASATAIQLKTAFSLDSQKKLSQKFLSAINDLDLPAANTVLVDQHSLGLWTSSLVGKPVSLSPLGPMDLNHIGVIQKADRDHFKSICAALNSKSASVSPISEGTPLAAASYSPDSSDYLKKWMGLVTSLHFASCDVLAGP